MFQQTACPLNRHIDVKRGMHMHKLYSNKKVILILIAPALLFFAFAILVPICMSVYYGLTDYTGMGKPNFVGVENFTNIVFHDPTFMKSLFHALLLGIGFVFIQHPICMLFAILVDRVSGKWEKFFRAAYFIPNVISVAVIASMWKYIFNYDFGLINNVLKFVGLGGLQRDWLDQNHALVSVLVVLIWHGFGWGMLIYYAGVKGIDQELYEAAAIDGATGVKTYWHITLPLMKPIIRVNVTLAIISALKQMETVYLLTNGGPGDTTQFVANYLYIKAFRSYQYGYGNAISVIFIIVCMLATVVLNRIFQTKQEEN